MISRISYSFDVNYQNRPDYVLVLPWNLREEVGAQLAYIREWGGQFITAVPALEVK